jgi:hypothetical protein
MIKILNSEVKNFKEWCCGKDLEENYYCGDIFNKTSRIICDDCLMNLTIRKSKIASIRKELIQLKYSKATNEKSMFIGYKKIDESLAQKIKRLENGRN